MHADTNPRYLEAIQERVLIYDGAMGTNLQQLKLTASNFGGEQYAGCNDYLVISFPQVVEKVHRSFLEVGVDVLETDTFRANRITLAEYGLAERVVEINREAAELARRLADEYSALPAPDGTIHTRFVAGSIGPTGKLPSADDPELSNFDYDELVGVFCEQAAGLLEGGVDVLLIETSQDILEVKAAIAGIHRAFREMGTSVPIQVQVTLDTTGRMLLGTDIAAALTILEGLAIDVVGLNCSTGPGHMREPIRYLGENSMLPVSCIPNAGLPLNVDGEAIYPLTPDDFAEALVDFVERHHVRVVGGCCGTTPEHLKVLVDKLRGYSLPRRSISSQPRLSSSITAVPMHQTPPPFLIGERCNAQGSRKFKRLLLEENYDAILETAREQVNGGAHALDVSVAVTERPDEVELMRAVVKKLTLGVDVPLVIDTTELDVMEAALKIAPGRCLLNSTHLESGREKADRVLRLAKEHNAAVLVLTIDERGMAKDVAHKLEVAQRIYDIAVKEHGLRPETLVFDTLTFTLATGDPEFSQSALQTLEGIRKVKEAFPGVLTSLGVSNVSFGLDVKARPVLNSVMLYHAVQAGLDMAIVNPAQITPYAEIPEEARFLCDDLIFNRRQDALQRFVEYFGQIEGGFGSTTEIFDPTVEMAPEARVHWRILHRHKEGVEEDIEEIIRLALISEPHLLKHDIAVNILNHTLLPAMKDVGDRFGAGELILPFVLQSAEVMKKAVTYVEQYLERKEGTTKGVVVLATVYGDVHDIGKNLVKTILANNGYTVIDLGKQVPAERIIQQAVDQQADAIGLSALLVNTSKQMPLIVNELNRRGLKIPVLVGGAAINRRFGWRMNLTEDGALYEPGVFYCKDAFEGLSTLDTLTNPVTNRDLLKQLQQDVLREQDRRITRTVGFVNTSLRSRTPAADFIPVPPVWGPRVVQQMPLEIVFQHLSLNELFRLSWGAKNARGEEWDHLQADFTRRLERMKKEAQVQGWLKPQGVYGYWPAQSEGNDLIFFDPESMVPNQPQEILRFTFPRQEAEDRQCLADYFAAFGSGKMDVVALQVVTVGQQATERFDRLQLDGNYTEAYFTHGLAVQTAEAAAEYLHRHIRRELKLPDGQGKRYSWGYPAIPELEGHAKVFNLLPVESELGMSLTAAFQLVPEQSTAAIIIHHPAARYFSLGESRLEQLTR
jgi:5-methyltetrahydrofolate--homocysteine methyltransferase